MLEKVRKVIKSAHNKEKFSKIIASIYATLDYRYELIMQAYNDGKDAFRGHSRRDGERYFEHLRATALILILYLRVTDHELIIAMLLHDIVEDKPEWTIERVKGKYGKRVAYFVELMSKPGDLFEDKKECEHIYFKRMKKAPREFFLLKLSDRLHNLLTMWVDNKEKIMGKIKETRLFLMPFAEEHCILIHELESAMEALEAKK